jgi:hypothetical protein
LLLEVNPFDQPGVEAYKKNMFALLGKPGYEAETEAIKARLYDILIRMSCPKTTHPYSWN